MYPKNAASPEPIAIGAVVQITDGAVQTSGVTVRIKPIGVAEADGANAAAYSTDGIVLYTPTQAETNYTSFVLIAKKTGCIPVALTIVTTSSATPGTVLLAPVPHTSAVVPTVTTLTGHTAQTGDSFARIGATGSGLTSLASQTSVNAIGSSSAITVERSVSDTNSITFAWPVSGATITGTKSINNATYGAVTGAIAFLRTETGKHYYTIAYNVADRPTAEGQVRYKLVDGTYTRYVVLRVATAVLDSAAILAVADQVWDEATSGHTTAGTYGGRIVRATNSNTEVQITGSNHIAADVHEFQTGVITAGDFAANSITASALATDAVTEIQSGLATSAALATESGKITNIENASGYLLAVLAGACADPQTASETYAITVFGSTFTVDMAGQTSTGTRTAPTLTKT